MKFYSRRDFFKSAAIGLASAELSCKKEEKEVAVKGKKEQIKPENWEMTAEESSSYVKDVLQTALQRVVDNPETILSIKDRVITEFTAIQNGQLLYKALGARRPSDPDTWAHVDYDPQQDKPVLMIFVPAVRRGLEQYSNEGFNQAELDNIIAIMYAHEQIHIEQAENYPFKDRFLRPDPYLTIKDEATAYGKTILEIMRPLMEKGARLPQNYINNSQQLKLVGDDYTNPAWISSFR